MKLTLKQLKKMEPGTIFAKGEIVDSPFGCNMTNSGKMLRWIAKRGDIYDWTIYLHWNTSSWEYVEDFGDKPSSEENIRRLVPCTDKALKMFRH